MGHLFAALYDLGAGHSAFRPRQQPKIDALQRTL